jgi:uncharacterized protein
MNREKAITFSVTLSSVVAIACVTHYFVCRMPVEVLMAIDVTKTSIDVNAFDANTGITPLMRAAIDSDYEKAKLLIEQGANVNIRSATADRTTALNFALINGGQLGSLSVAELLIENGADVNAAGSPNALGLAPIHAIMQITQIDNRWKILQSLLAHGAHINAQSEDGSTMMHIAVTTRDVDWIDRLNEEYGQIINYNIKDNKGRTPLQLAIELGHVSLNDAWSPQNSLEKRPVYIGNDFNVRATDNQGRTGFQLAVIREDWQFVTALLEHGADINHQDLLGNTALHYAVVGIDPKKYVEFLLSKKAATNIANSRGQTPLMLVMNITNPTLRLKIAHLLVEAGSPLAYKNSEGNSIFDLAVAAHDQPLADYIGGALKARSSK